MSSACGEVALFYEKYKNLKKHDVFKIFEWLEENPHLPKLTELQVILFLNSCSYNVDFAKNTIQNYFFLKQKSDLFVPMDENLIKRTTSVVFMGVLPKRTAKNEIVGLSKFLDPAPEKYNCEECVKFMLNYLTLYLHLNGPSDGIILVLDSEHMSFGHFWRMKLGALRQILYYVQEALPVTIKGVHLLNVLPVTKHVLAFLKPFIKQEIYELIEIHPGGVESLYEYVPKNCLPKEYGGELDSYHVINEKNLGTILENMKLLEWLNAQNMDESKRKVVKRKGFFGAIYDYFV